ncbi:MAG: SLBB domain-containing protein [Fimbriimonas ginsengisoli]|uniref:SLBB domain-containing protein n=1 Tax=Fimbriimonas ginsengisoli TaxID=1005039 RepID=A0A931M1J7_FIMGI|nr:SLBB domain-containing protein [Fimbriimonas ginsengisoli]
MGRRFESGWRHHLSVDPMPPRNILTRSALALSALVCISAACLAKDVLAPRDRVEIICEDDPSLCLMRSVTADGYLSLPIIGAVDAAGPFADGVAGRIEQALAARGLAWRVRVRRALDPCVGVFFSGAVGLAGSTAWRKGLRVSEVLALAAPLRTSGLEKVLIVNAVGGRDTVDASAMGFAGSVADGLLQPGDRLSVPLAESPSEVYVLGGVHDPGAKPWRAGMTVEDALAAAGGVSPHGDPAHIDVESKGEPSSGRALRRGDVVRVGLRSVRAFVSVTGAVQRPGVVAFRPGLTLTQALAEAGGPAERADVAHVILRSLLRRKSATYDLKTIASGKVKDPVLSASDSIEIPTLGAAK